MQKRRNVAVALLMLLTAFSAWAQNPVHFTVSQKQVSPTELDVTFTGKIDAGWHVYSPGLPADGPISASVTTEKCEGAKPLGKVQAKGKEISTFDKIFEMNLRYFENSVTFVQRYQLTGGKYHVSGFLEYGTCNDEMCMPPGNVEFDYQGEIEKKEEATPTTGPIASPDASKEGEGLSDEKEGAQDGATADSLGSVRLSAPLDGAGEVSAAAMDSLWWQPSISEL